jgi:hypothetical protein
MWNHRLKMKPKSPSKMGPEIGSDIVLHFRFSTIFVSLLIEATNFKKIGRPIKLSRYELIDAEYLG